MSAAGEEAAQDQAGPATVVVGEAYKVRQRLLAPLRRLRPHRVHTQLGAGGPDRRPARDHGGGIENSGEASVHAAHVVLRSAWGEGRACVCYTYIYAHIHISQFNPNYSCKRCNLVDTSGRLSCNESMLDSRVTVYE